MCLFTKVFLTTLFTMNFYFISFIFLYNFIHINSEKDICEIGANKECSKSNGNKYSKEANSKYLTYYQLIEAANKSYVECTDPTCNCYSSVITKNLKPFENGITKSMIKKISSKGTKYQIIKGHLYRDKDCMFPARCSGIEHFLLKLAPKLPDTEFIINTRDWPQSHRQYGTFGPIFSFSKTEEYYDIMYPAWAFWEGGPAIGLYPKGIGNWADHRVTIAKVANETQWESKIDKAFFRGSRTSSERDALVLLSRKLPDLVDAQYTKNQAWKSDADTLHAAPAAEVSFVDHCRYKYLFNFRGVAASFRFKHILLCKSVIFHVGDEWLEFFYPFLKPWIHYIPVPANAKEEDLKALLDFAKNNNELVKEIALKGFNFIWNHLKISDVNCFWKKLLKKYSKLLKYKPELDGNLIEII